MYSTPTIFITQLLVAMQVLMTLDMPLSATMALPVTSKPIESTVENLAWQAWIELPPEIKQQVKSRKVTPKSIFTLPNRIECPEGHKQVDTKCIPIVIGTNADLIALNYLSLIAGNSPTDEQYDYDDVMEEDSPLNFGPQMQIGEEELTAELKPPTKDEPLKFNIFENKFNIYNEEPLEDYSSLSNESGGGSVTAHKEIANTSLNVNLNPTVVNVTDIKDLVSDISNKSESNAEVSSNWDSELAESNTLTTLADITDFRIDAIALPASGLEIQKPHKLSIFHKDSSIQLVTTVMDMEAEKKYEKGQQEQENDIQTLLQTESLLPLLNQTTATTFLNTPLPSSTLTTVPMEENSSDAEFTLNIGEDEEMTTTPNIMEQNMETKDKIEHTRSVTMNPLISDENDSNDDDGKDTTLETIMNDEPLDTTTTIQLDDTTIIENTETIIPESLSTSHFSSADSIDLKELLLRQEQAFKDFEELQRMRKGQTDKHTVLKKSKVEPVEVLSTTMKTTTMTTNTTAMPVTTTKTMDELITAETVTPLLTVHNENDNNNDRFYYQHFAKQDLEIATDSQRTNNELTPATPATTKTSEATAAATTLSEIVATMPTTITSEIDLAEELRLINELVKGIRPATTTAVTTTKTPSTTTSEIITSPKDDIDTSSTYMPSTSESSASTLKPTLSTSQIWSKIMPLLTTPKESSTIRSTLIESSSSQSSNDIKTTSELSSLSNRSHRNSKIIRINGFNTITSTNFPNTSSSTTTKTTTTTTTTEDPPSIANLEDSSSTSDNSYESYWWLPVAWRLDKPIRTEKQQSEQEVNKKEEQPLLLRFWSAYHAPRSS